MGRSPCCDADANMRRGPWLTEEDEKLREYIEENGAGNWKNLPKLAGLNRCGKSCRLRWANYLRPDIKRGMFSEEEEQMIIHFHSIIGNKWSAIAARLPGRTDNEIKNYWNTHLRKKLLNMGIDPVTHRPRTDHLNLLANVPLNLIAAAANLSNLTQFTANPLLNALQLPQLQLLQNLLQVMATNSSPPNFDAMNQLLGSPFLNGPLALRNPNLMALENLSSNLLDTAMMPNLTINGSTEAIAPPMNNYGSSSSSSWEHGDVGNNCGGSSSSYITTTTTTTTPTATSTPSLVPASPENSVAEQVQEPVNDSRGNVAISSPTSKPFDAWGGLNLDELDSDLGWKDILNQIQWSDALM